MAHLMQKAISVGLRTHIGDGVEQSYFSIGFSAKNVGSTPAYRVFVKGVVNKNKDGRTWEAVIPKDVGPDEYCEVKFFCDDEPLSDSELNRECILSIYLKFETVFTRGKGTKPNQIRFDYRLNTKPSGRVLASRI